jgi:uncharacterized protein YbjT (DUF2867 family)
MKLREIFLTGGTGYLGRPLVAELLGRGHSVRSVVRPGSQTKLPAGCVPVIGNVLDGESYRHQIQPGATFVQLTGVAHPSPSKSEEFRSVDLKSAIGAVQSAKAAGADHFVYVSVAHPAPVMKAYIAVRMQCEAVIRESGLNATILRPWYVLGPGHRWPYTLLPMYWLMDRLPKTRAGARRLGLVTHKQMINALLHAVENHSHGVQILEVPEIRGWGNICKPAPACSRENFFC